MNAQEVTAEYRQQVREILDWYHIVVDAAKEQKRKALEELEVWFTDTFDGLKEEKE